MVDALAHRGPGGLRGGALSSLPPLARAGYEQIDDDAATSSSHLARRWWDANAAEYLSEHASALGDADLTWGPEGLREADAHLLGPLAELREHRVLEVGSGAAQCSRWLRAQGVDAVASDVSGAMLERSREIDARTGVMVPVVQADARELPFASATFDVVFTSYGVLPFVPDAERVHREVARVLKPAGRWVFSTTHPVRWAFPDDPGPAGLTATRAYADTRPYVERAENGEVIYAEHHRTLSEHVRQVVAAGFLVDSVTEPSWQPGRATWGGWSELRARHLPGTLVLGCVLRG